MATTPSALFTIARHQHGLLTTEQISASGLSPHRRRKLVHDGVLHELHVGVFRLESSESSLVQRCLAVCLADPSAVICGPTAGALRSLRKMPTGSIHAMALRRNRRLDGVTFHRTQDLGDNDVTIRRDGIRLLSAPRLAFDLARHLDDHDLESVIEQLLDRRACTVRSLFDVTHRLARQGREGSVRMDRVLRSRPAWSKPLQSDLEAIVLRGLRERGIELEPQLRVEMPTGEALHLDGGDRLLRFGVEVDHVTWHGGRVDAQYDKRRDRQLQREGWVVPRVTDADVRERLVETLDDLESIYVRLVRRNAS